MLRREVFKFFGAGGAVLASGCGTPQPSGPPSAALAKLPPDVQPYRTAPATPPRTLPHPPGTVFFAPKAPVFPYYTDRDAVLRDAQGISDALERYINAWLAGRLTHPNAAEIPKEFLPPGVNLTDFPRFRLVRAADLRPEDVWAARWARPITRAGYVGFFPDPNVTYLVIPAMLLPFGHKVVVEGEFPRARFFDLQVTPAFRPEDYRYDGGIGVAEVPIVDADIDPLPGHGNPFRLGANRNLDKRSWRVEFPMVIGDAMALNPAFRPPFFRGQGNVRYGSGLMFQGAWGAPGSNGHGRGLWDTGQLWARYYLPDRRADGSVDPLAGVPLPRAWYETPTGERYFIAVDLEPYNRRANRVVQIPEGAPTIEPSDKRLSSARYGWNKQTGIFRAVVAGIALNTGWAPKEYVRNLDKGVAGRGSDLDGPAVLEQSATSATYIDYLVRGMELGRGKVVVLTGRLPTYPKTLRGDARFAGGEMRYWSLTGYQVPAGLDFAKAFDKNAVIGVAVHCVCDEEMVLDAQRRYVICLSRPQDRPANATAAAGVTWVDWGPSPEVSWTLRWLTVGPEWQGSNTPTPQKIGRKADWPEREWDPSAIGTNSHNGALGEYLPRIHYLDASEFAKLGQNVTMDRVPLWRA